MLATFAAGALFGLERIDEKLERRLPIALHGTQVTAEVEIVSSPAASGLATRFEGEVRAPSPKLPRRLRVTWFEAPEGLAEGDIWSLNLKLRSPIGTLNERSFDYEAWLLAGGVDALATVKAGILATPSRGTWVQAARQRLRDFVASMELANRGPLLALSIGEASMMQRDEWRIFRHTGTVHLMVISGLHLGLVAFYAGLIGNCLARLAPQLCGTIPAQIWGVFFGICAALAFAMLCGWTLPVRRAFIMICCAAVALIWRRPIALANAWLVALILVLGVNPFASLAPGFWLSFGAVGLLMLMGWNVERQKGFMFWAKQLVRTQMLLSLGMAPLLLLTVSELPLVSVVANLLAVPVTTLIVVPLVLVSDLLVSAAPAVAEGSMTLADHVFSAQMLALEYFATWPRAVAATLNPVIGGACIASVLCFFLPVTWPLRALLVAPGMILALVLMPSSPKLPHGEFGLRLLDVGQGLSVLVETRSRTLLFDAGARFSDDFDFGDAVVVPEVQLAGYRRLDRLIVSHWDNDHAGGAASVIAELDVPRLLAAADGAARFPLGDATLARRRLDACQSGEAWVWDGVRFRVLHPEAEAGGFSSNNDRSCVLLIENDEHAALLPADISQAVEFEIMADVPKLDVLVAAHHGSRSSSSMSFLRRTRPALVLVSSGFDNRFGHPHEDRMQAWRSVGAEVFGTARLGALRWRSSAADGIESARARRAAFWRISAQNA